MEEILNTIVDYSLHAILYLSILLGALHIGTFLIEKITNKLSVLWPAMWYLVEYMYYKKEFKEWIKDKPRHSKVKQTQQ